MKRHYSSSQGLFPDESWSVGTWFVFGEAFHAPQLAVPRSTTAPGIPNEEKLQAELILFSPSTAIQKVGLDESGIEYSQPGQRLRWGFLTSLGFVRVSRAGSGLVPQISIGSGEYAGHTAFASGGR